MTSESRQSAGVTLAGAIDERSPVPYYFQLAMLISNEITGGRWPVGARIPSESELCTTMRVSRTTVREALSRLEQEGLVRRQRGKGSFVADRRRRSWLLQSHDGFMQDEVGRLGRKVTSTVLSAGRAELPKWATDALSLPAESEGVTLERLRAVDGLTALYVVNHLPLEFAETVLSITEQPHESLYERLRSTHGIEVSGGRRVLEAVAANEAMARLLEVEIDAPLALIESTAWDSHRRPFDCYRAFVRTDRMKIEIEVASTRDAGSAVIKAVAAFA